MTYRTFDAKLWMALQGFCVRATTAKTGAFEENLVVIRSQKRAFLSLMAFLQSFELCQDVWVRECTFYNFYFSSGYQKHLRCLQCKPIAHIGRNYHIWVSVVWGHPKEECYTEHNVLLRRVVRNYTFVQRKL